MTKSGIAFALMILGGFPILPALAGNDSSTGGADDYRVLPAFFLGWDGVGPVRACYEIAPDFGIGEEFIANSIQQTFKEWGDYMKTKRLNIVPPGEYKIRTQLDLRSACKGDENLVFYFGVENEEIKHYRSQFSNPYGFAQKTQSGDSNVYPNTEGKGFIWIAPSGAIDPKRRIPFWAPATRDALAGLLLHEVGHVFGNSHVEDTVMTEKISNYLDNDTDIANTSSRTVSKYSKIDSVLELVPCLECRASYTAAETFDPLMPPGESSDWVRTFRLLTGKEPLAPLVIRFERLGSPQGSGKLTLMDALDVYSFDVSARNQNGVYPGSGPLFYGHGGTSFTSFGASFFSRIHPLVGDDIMVSVNYNAKGVKAEILPMDQDFIPHPIFVSAP